MASEAALEAERPTLRGSLEHQGGLLPVTLALASAVSLRATFDGERAPPRQTVFSHLTVKLPDAEVELSRCMLADEARPHGRLVFLDDIYDCRRLVLDGKLVNVRGFFQNLPLVLAHKDRIRPAFREYAADLVYELSVYKKFFNEQDRLLAGEPGAAARAAQQALIATEGPGFFAFFDARLEQLASLVKDFDQEEHERHGFYLRRLAWDYILGSEFLKRTNLKPRGYAGDAEMMVMAYRNEHVGRYVFNKLMHKHPLETPAAQAVRSRRRLIADGLRSVRERFGAAGPLQVMSVAAGPAWELHDIFSAADDAARYHCALLDQDPHAFVWAKETVRQVESALGRRIGVTYVNQSVRTLLRGPPSMALPGRFHFIYSMGLFDYLTPPVARTVLRRLYELLVPGGALLVGNYHVANPTRLYMAYWMDWVLYHRTEEELLELSGDLPCAQRSLTFDPTRCQMFLRLESPA